MRLVNTNTLQLEWFPGGVPQYGILSHTWGDEEVTLQEWQATLQDWQASDKQHQLVPLLSKIQHAPLAQDWLESLSPKDPLRRFGFWKILKACLQARGDGLDFLWVDTNCIDKSSSAELSEAINSMYAWYRNASVCYAYLVDVHGVGDEHDVHGNGTYKILRRSRWFRRGWTLQELLAPKDVRFFARDWTPMGTKRSLALLMTSITGVDEKYLLHTEDSRSASIAQRMAWVANRTTTRLEDIAYCMLGLFDVNMPLIYGEGAKAFVRLQEEILRMSEDYSIFAWTWIPEMMHLRRVDFCLHPNKPGYPVNRLGLLGHDSLWRDPLRPTLLAPDPVCFFEAGGIPSLSPGPKVLPFTMTNIGLTIPMPILGHLDGKLFFAVIDQKQDNQGGTLIITAIPLVRHFSRPDRFTRTWFPSSPITIVRQVPYDIDKTETIQVCRDTQHAPFQGFYDAFGGTSHQYGFWLVFPKYMQTTGFQFDLLGGCVSGDGVFNSYGIFVDPVAHLGTQIVGGLLLFRVKSLESWRWWRDTVAVLFLGLELKQMFDGTFKTASYHCEMKVFTGQNVEAPALLKDALARMKGRLADGGQSSIGSEATWDKTFTDYEAQRRVHAMGYAYVRLLNHVPLSHSPGAKITLTELGFSTWR
jgi:hypothetical protein